jgi:site-specific recombinase XerD
MLQEIAIARTVSLAVITLEEASSSVATQRAYRIDAADFTSWCGTHGLEPLPAHVSTVAAYLAGLAKAGLKASTITRRCAGIR